VLDQLLDLLAWIPEELIILFIAMLPLIELRGAIPVAIGIFHMPIPEAFILSVIGNMIPIPFILIFFKDVEAWLRKREWWDRWFERLYERTRSRAGEKIKKYEELGVILFVAIPLPGTGAWTGSLIAYLFGLRYKISLAIIFLGVIIAGILVTAIVEMGLNFL